MSRGIDWPESALWQFSLETYGLPGVEAACLDLQRRLDLDVNVLFLCCWLARRGLRLDEVGAARIASAVQGWQMEVVRPLRALRRRLKVRLADPEPDTVFDATPDIASAIRAGVLNLELDGEHLEQLVLEELAAGVGTPAPAGAGLATENLCRFWPLDPGDGALQTVLAAVFGDDGGATLSDSRSRADGAPTDPTA